MIFSRLIVLSAMAVSAVLNGYSEPASFVVAENGVIQADIVIPADPVGVEKYAAEELKYHLEKAFGSPVRVVTENKFEPSHYPYHFFIGKTKAAAAKSLPGRELTLDERFLRTVGNGFYLLGNDSPVRYDQIGDTGAPMKLGTLYAVYDFLEMEMGVKWIWPGEIGEVIPKCKNLVLKLVDRSGVEPLNERFWYGTVASGEVTGFSSEKAMHGFYEKQKRFLVRHRVGRRAKTIRAAHSFADWWERFGKEHPEYFNLLPDGTRRPFSSPGLVTMCVSQPGVWKQKVADWKKWHDVHCKGADPYEPWVNCCENDVAGLCQCAACRAWDEPDERFAKCPYWKGGMTREFLDNLRRQRGNYSLSELMSDTRWVIPDVDANVKPVAPLSDRYAKFYNHVLAEARKVNPEARVIAYAYENYTEAPKKTKVDPGVIIEFVPRSYFPYDKTESKFFRKHFAGWRKAGVKDFTLRPNYMLAGGNYPFDQGRLILEDFAFAYTNGMMGCAYDSMRGSWSSHVMMLYALTRAFRDPLHGYDKAREELLSAFGPARGVVARYLDAVYDHTTKWSFVDVRKIAWANANGRHSGGSFGSCAAILAEFFDDAFFKKANPILDEAVAAANGDKEIVARVEFLRKGLRDAELTRDTRVKQKAWLPDKADAVKKAAFLAAFEAMNAYRARIESDCVANYKIQSFRERSSMDWPHKTVKE